MNCVIFLTIILNFKSLALDLSKGKSCVTPYGQTATCKLLQECGVILTALITEGDRGQRLFKDSQCGCDVGMVCCGPSSNRSYTPLIDCAPPPKPEKILVAKVSDGSVCGLDSSTDRIKGGGVVKFEEHPWVAALEYQSTLTNENAGFRCGGSLITESYVLTAAHCIVDVEFMLIKVWLGLTNISSEEYCPNVNAKVQCINTVHKMNVKNTIPHEFYNSLDKYNDVGLIQLEKATEFSVYIRPICLPSSDSELPRMGTYLTVAGWGTTENRQSSEIKLKVEVPLKDNNICKEYLKKFYQEITSQQLCAGGERGKDACQGDSGGPLMYDLVSVSRDAQWYQQGIVSYGTGCGIQGRPGVYIKVSSYVNWIYSKIHNTNSGLEKDEPCISFNGSIATCVPVNTCEEIFKLVSTKSKSIKKFVGKSTCSYDQHDGALACCENPGTIIIPNWNSTALPDKTTCGILKNEPRIDGTEIKDLANFPWVAGIEYFSKDSNTTGIKCTGTVINSRYVLTSLDCFYMSDPPVNVWLGHWNTSAYHDCKEGNNTVDCTNSVQKIKIKSTVAGQYYPLYLFFLETEIRFSDYINAICLPLPNVPKLEPGTPMTVLRWTGELEDGFITSSDMILREEVSLVENDKCSGGISLSSLDLCAGDENKNSCNRILGAPLMRTYEDKPNGRMQWYLEGVVHFVSVVDCIYTYKDYAIYTPVASDMAWIINIISDD